MRIHIIKKVTIVFLLAIMLCGTMQVFAMNYSENTIDEVMENDKKEVEVIDNQVAGQLIKVKDHTKKELEDYKELYGSEGYGITAYILNKVRLYSIPLCFIGIAVGAIFQYVIGIRKLDLRDRGLHLIVAFITVLVICQVLPLIYAIVVRGWRG